MKDRIEARIHLHRKENPIFSSELEEMFNISGEKLRTIIHELRSENKPIASSRNGYFWAKDLFELQETINHLEGREISIRRVRHSLEKCFDDNNQMSFI